MATHTADPDPEGSRCRDALPSDVVDGLLASRARRRLLHWLREAGEPVAVGDLAARLAAAEESTDEAGEPDDGIAADPRQARRQIYQRHLPRLTATGVVTFDSRLGTVEFTGGSRLAARLDDGAVADPERGVRTKDK
jgi:DNA-binding transcriptional ArsR family regulator